MNLITTPLPHAECESVTPSSPRVSICLITYNGAATIERALNSLLAQTYRDFEHIISDDHSSDETLTICQSLTSSDDRARFIHPPHNLGADPNLRFAMSHARGKYHLSASQDDYWEPQFLERLVPALEQKPTAVCAMGCVRYITPGREPIEVHYTGRDLPERQSRLKLAISTLLSVSWEGKPLTRNNIFIYGLMDRENYTAAIKAHARAPLDRQMVCHLALTGDFVYVDEVLFHYTRHLVKPEKGRRPASDPTVIEIKNNTRWRFICGTLAGIIRSPVIRRSTKLVAVPSLFLAFWWFTLVVDDGPRRRWIKTVKGRVFQHFPRLPRLKPRRQWRTVEKQIVKPLHRLPEKAWGRTATLFRRLKGKARKPLHRWTRTVEKRVLKPLLRLPNKARRRATRFGARKLLRRHMKRIIHLSERAIAKTPPGLDR
ncbi:MAG: glycosyltransferase family 2 protein [Methyloceanibacter sp.]